MAVNKNFVVKNGLEVDTDLIFADASTDRVGIGSTIPGTALDVKGGIAVTDINASGVGTIVTLRSTTGIITTLDAVHIRATNLNISGITTVADISPRNLNVSGVTSTGSLQVVGTGNMPLGIITHIQGTNINYSGIGTIANVIFTKDASGVGATIGAAVGMVTYYGDGVNLLNTGGGIGIGSTQGIVGYGFTTLNFIGAGNTFKTDGTSIDISISGGGGGGSVSIGSEAPSAPTSGSLWYHTEYGRTFVYFDEVSLGIGNTAVWVDAAPFNQGGQFVSKYGDNAFGAIGYTGGTTSQASIYYTSDPNTGIYFPSNDHVGVVAGGTASLVVNPNGVTVTGILTGNGSGLTGVASTDHINTGTAVTITNNVNVTGVTTLTGALTVTGITTLGDDVTFTGAAANVTWDKSVDDLIFNDNAKAAFGSGSDLTIYHDASKSYLVNSTGNLEIQNGSNSIDLKADGFTVKNGSDNETMITADADGAVKLYNDNTKTFATSADGVLITNGTSTAMVKIIGGETNRGELQLIADDGDDNNDNWSFQARDGGKFNIQNYGSGSWANSAVFTAGGEIDLYHNGSIKLTTSSGGVSVTGACTATSFVGDGSALTGIAAGGSGEFNTSISGATQYDVTTSMAAAFTAAATATNRTIIHSIHICNISASEASISGEIQASFSFAHNIPVPAGSAVELLKQPKVLGPSETIELQSDTASALEATIIAEVKEDTDYWDAAIDLTSAATLTDIYVSTTNPSVVQSILLANDDGTNDVKARVAWTDGSNNIQSYLCYDMVIPAESTVELCEKPKYLATGYKLRGYANAADRLEITASGKQITS